MMTSDPSSSSSSSSSSILTAFLLYLHHVFAGGALKSLVGIPLLLILTDLVSGVASALKRGVFNTTHLADFLGRDLMKYLVCFLLLVASCLLFGVDNPLTALVMAPMGILAISVASSITANIAELFPHDPLMIQIADEELQKLVPNFPASPATPAPDPPALPSVMRGTLADIATTTLPAVVLPPPTISPPPPAAPANTTTTTTTTTTYQDLMQSLLLPNLPPPPPPPPPASVGGEQ